jgi:diacylglycerol kinase family enzyme
VPYETHITQSSKDAGRIGVEILRKARAQQSIAKETVLAPIKVVIVGGDGTAHELIEGVLEDEEVKLGGEMGRWEFAIVPLGTVSCLVFRVSASHLVISTMLMFRPHRCRT